MPDRGYLALIVHEALNLLLGKSRSNAEAQQARLQTAQELLRGLDN